MPGARCNRCGTSARTVLLRIRCLSQAARVHRFRFLPSAPKKTGGLRRARNGCPPTWQSLDANNCPGDTDELRIPTLHHSSHFLRVFRHGRCYLRSGPSAGHPLPRTLIRGQVEALQDRPRRCRRASLFRSGETLQEARSSSNFGTAGLGSGFWAHDFSTCWPNLPVSLSGGLAVLGIAATHSGRGED